MLHASGMGQQRLLSEMLEVRLRSWLGRCAGIALVGIAVLCWLSLLLWTTPDQIGGRSAEAASRHPLGATGAAVSDLLLQLLGIASVFALIGPLVFGVELAIAQPVTRARLKAALFPLSVLLLAGGCSGLPTYSAWPLHNGFGGTLGDLVFNLSAAVLSGFSPDRGATVAGLALLAGGAALLIHCLGFRLADLASTSRGQVRAAAAEVSRWWDFAPGAQLKEPAPPVPAPAPAPAPLDPVSVRHASAPPTSQAVAPARRVQEPAPPRDLSEPGSRGALFDEVTEQLTSLLARRFAPQRPGAPGPSPLDALPHLQRAFAAPQPVVEVLARPSLDLLQRPEAHAGTDGLGVPEHAHGRVLESALDEFGIAGRVREVKPGPAVTLYEVELSRGIKASRVVSLADDIARAMGAQSVRVSGVSGRSTIAFEVANARRERVPLRAILSSDAYLSSPATLPIALGSSVTGQSVVADLARMPHLLVAGATGSGKSTGLHAMILSLLFKHDPERCRFLLIDPKVGELSVYDGIPHLVMPVVTTVDGALGALEWAVREMHDRLKRMAKLGANSIEVYNSRLLRAMQRGEGVGREVHTGFDPRTGRAIVEHETIAVEPLPHVVIVVDELAELMVAAGRRVEPLLGELARGAPAAGVHIVVATQRTSADVVTAAIKASFPRRLAYRMASRGDAEGTLDIAGADQLLGEGDALLGSSAGTPLRVHGAYVSRDEVERVAGMLREQSLAQPGRFRHGASQEGPGLAVQGRSPGSADDDAYRMAVAVVGREQWAWRGLLTRRLAISPSHAGELLLRLEHEGLVGPANMLGYHPVLALEDRHRSIA